MFVVVTIPFEMVKKAEAEGWLLLRPMLLWVLRASIEPGRFDGA
jgi:hypothetical protein